MKSQLRFKNLLCWLTTVSMLSRGFKSVNTTTPNPATQSAYVPPNASPLQTLIQIILTLNLTSLNTILTTTDPTSILTSISATIIKQVLQLLEISTLPYIDSTMTTFQNQINNLTAQFQNITTLMNLQISNLNSSLQNQF